MVKLIISFIISNIILIFFDFLNQNRNPISYKPYTDSASGVLYMIIFKTLIDLFRGIQFSTSRFGDYRSKGILILIGVILSFGFTYLIISAVFNIF